MQKSLQGLGRESLHRVVLQAAHVSREGLTSRIALSLKCFGFKSCKLGTSKVLFFVLHLK